MSNSKTKLYHTYADEPPFECSTGDMTDDGLEIILDKRTHELLIPKERETEETVTVIVRPKGGPALVEEPGDVVTAGADVPRGGVAVEFPRCRRERVEREVAESARRGLELFWRRRRGEILKVLSELSD
jgi:hypothetical protein